MIVSGVDESQADGLPPFEMALQLAELKCAAVADRDEVPEGALVLGCDSVLELDGQALGKPTDAADAVRRWQAMRGGSGVLYTGHCLRDTATGRVAAATASTTVSFADLSDAEIEAYVATGEPLHVAGAFTVDGLGGAFVTGIDGDHHNVVGVSLPLLRDLASSWATPGPTSATPWTARLVATDSNEVRRARLGPSTVSTGSGHLLPECHRVGHLEVTRARPVEAELPGFDGPTVADHRPVTSGPRRALTPGRGLKPDQEVNRRLRTAANGVTTVRASREVPRYSDPVIHSTGRPRPRAMSIRWTSEVPSPISRILASR